MSTEEVRDFSPLTDEEQADLQQYQLEIEQAAHDIQGCVADASCRIEMACTEVEDALERFSDSMDGLESLRCAVVERLSGLPGFEPLEDRIDDSKLQLVCSDPVKEKFFREWADADFDAGTDLRSYFEVDVFDSIGDYEDYHSRAADLPTELPVVEYKIVRFFQEQFKPNEDVRSGVTLEEAQAWCQSDESRGDGWFDGYRKIG